MSYTLQLNAKAPNFRLKATDGQFYTLDNFSSAKALVIFFTCNHCPYVIGSNDNTTALAQEYASKGVTFVGINSNSKKTYEEDSYENMVALMKKEHFPWTYLHDETQSVVKAYGALKTPHFFLFDQESKLIYTGRAINQPRNSVTSSTHELKDALDQYLSGKKIEVPLTNPIGCNIKWDDKPAHWMPPDACDIV